MAYKDWMVRGRKIGAMVMMFAAMTAGRRRGGDGFRIRWKRVDLINCDSAFEVMAAPI